jgi:hypothetical protein
VEAQVALPLLPLRLHVVKVPDLLLVMPTEPVGVIGVPVLVSVTLTVHTVPVPARSVVGEQLTESEVVREFTVRIVEPMPPLAQFVLDRAKVPDIVFAPDEEGKYVTEHVEVSAPEADRVQVPEGVKEPPVGLTVNVTVP